MPARRTYASRGVPRPAPTRRSARRFSPPLLVALCGVVAVVAIGGVALFNPWASGAQLAAPADPHAAASASLLQSPSGSVSAAGPVVLQMGDVGTAAAGAPPAPGADGASQNQAGAPTPQATLRQRDARAPGIGIDPRLGRQLERTLIAVD